MALLNHSSYFCLGFGFSLTTSLAAAKFHCQRCLSFPPSLVPARLSGGRREGERARILQGVILQTLTSSPLSPGLEEGAQIAVRQRVPAPDKTPCGVCMGGTERHQTVSCLEVYPAFSSYFFPVSVTQE